MGELQRFLGPLALGDVHIKGRHVGRMAVFAFQKETVHQPPARAGGVVQLHFLDLGLSALWQVRWSSSNRRRASSRGSYPRGSCRGSPPCVGPMARSQASFM